MKTILTLLLTFLSVAYAALPTTNTVFVRQIGGSTHVVCRELFALYDATYHTTTTIRIVPGANGLLATKQFVNSTDDLPLLCGGTSEFAFNSIDFPENRDYVQKFKTISVLTTGPYVFTTRSNSSYSTVWQLKQSKKHLIVGVHTAGLQLAASVVFGEKDVTYVNYKSPQDALSSLLDGSLDVYVSGGAFSTLTEARRLKTIGITQSGFSTISLDREYPILTQLPLIVSLHSHSTLPNLDAIELNKRIEVIIASPTMQPTLTQFDNVHTPNNITKATTIVNQATDLVERLHQR